MQGTIQKEIKAMYSLLPQSLQVGANNGTGVDTKGFAEAMIVIMAGAVTSNGSHAFKVQESSDDAVADAYADISSATFTAITADNDNAVYVGRLNLRTRERYIRVVDTGTSQVMEGAALILLSGAKVKPVSQANTVAFTLPANQ